MKITFVLPTIKTEPVGGYKVVYEYANRFADKGDDVSIIYPIRTKISPKTKCYLLALIKINLKYLKRKKRGDYKGSSWFKLNPKIKEEVVPTLAEKNIPDSDIIFATAWSTATEVNKYSELKGKKYYLIQSFEDWDGPLEEVVSTWKMPLKKIVIAKHLKAKAEELDEDAFLIENGLDFKSFYNEKKIKKKNQIMMLYHKNEEVKQSKKALEKLIEIKKDIKDLKIVLFGTEKRPEQLPEWIEYYQKPIINKLRELFNESSLFISPSKIEGWALPPAEAMQCGTCVCVTDIQGHEYIEHMKTGYKVDLDLENLDKAVKKLLDDDELRDALAKKGNQVISNYTWEVAFDKMNRIIERK